MAMPPQPLVESAAHASQAPRQRLRLRRFLFASAFSLLYLVVLAVFHTQGRIDDVTMLNACAIVAALIAAFCILFVTGLNLRFPDPSLTAWQFLASVFTMVYVAYAAPDTRLVFTAFLFVALMFAMLRHDGRTLAGLGGMALVAFALLILLRLARHESGETIRLDLLQFLVMTVTLPWFVFIGNHVKR
jgi:hypothetical protein